jgi:hypothetical protein
MSKDLLVSLAKDPSSHKCWESEIRPAIEAALMDVKLSDLSSYLINLNASPFTIQRISELLIDPTAHTLDPIKYGRALEKCLRVSSPLRQGSRDDMMMEIDK